MWHIGPRIGWIGFVTITDILSKNISKYNSFSKVVSGKWMVSYHYEMK